MATAHTTHAFILLKYMGKYLACLVIFYFNKELLTISFEM